MIQEIGRDVLKIRRTKHGHPGKEKEIKIHLFSGIFANFFVAQENKAGKQDTKLSSLKCLYVRLKSECNDFKEGKREEKLSSLLW